MGEHKHKTVSAATKGLTEHLANNNRLIDGGFDAMCATIYKGKKTPAELSELRMAYLAGAQHIWGSIFVLLDGDAEPTEQDLQRMSGISEEMQRAETELKGYVAACEESERTRGQ